MGEPHCCSQRVLVLYPRVADTFPLSVHIKVLRKKMNFADTLVCRLMVVKEPAQVSLLSQLQQPRTEMFTLRGIPKQSSTQLSENSWKPFRDFIFFYFYCSVEKQMFNDGYFRMHLVLFPPSLKAAAKGCICCSVSRFPCFEGTHSKNFARALRWRYVPQT